MLKRLLLLSVCLYSVAAFATATDGRIQCEENLSSLDCMQKACTEMTNIQNVNSKADYDKVKSKWYDKIKAECPIADLQKLYDKATKSESVYKISIPKSSVATTRHYINLKLNPDKIRPEYTGTFSYFFSNDKYSNYADLLTPNISTECSDFSVMSGSPVDSAAVNKGLKNLSKYSTYRDIEYYIAGGWLTANYTYIMLMVNYNESVEYSSYETATTNLDTIVEGLSRGACCGLYVHLINNYKEIIDVKQIPC